jgi:hypothetical protein
MADQMVQPKFFATGGQEIDIGLTLKPVSPWTLRLLPPRPEGYVLDVDSTVVERCGEQEGALQGYNPRKRGGVTHHPVLAGLFWRALYPPPPTAERT